MAASVLLLHFPLYPPSAAERATFQGPVHIHLKTQVAQGSKRPAAAKLQTLLGLFRLLLACCKPEERRPASTSQLLQYLFLVRPEDTFRLACYMCTAPLHKLLVRESDVSSKAHCQSDRGAKHILQDPGCQELCPLGGRRKKGS